MGYIDIQNREDIDILISDTLSQYFSQTIKISNDYSSNAFILNPRLNAARTYGASKSVIQAIQNGHAVYRNIFLYWLMRIYISIAFSKKGYFHCKYLEFEKLPQLADELLIMPGNMKIKIFNYKDNNVVNLVKPGFSNIPFEKEKKIRIKPLWDFVLPMICLKSSNGYEERLINGCSIDRCPFNLQQKYEEKIKQLILTIQKNGREEQNTSEYTQRVIDKIQGVLEKLNIEPIVHKSIEVFCDSLLAFCKSDKILLACSHGDLQMGNIFVETNGKLWILDWETHDIRSLGYDLLTYYYSFRYRRDYVSRIRSFLDDKVFEKKFSTFYDGMIPSSSHLLAVYLLEDILWVSEECAYTNEHRPSQSLLQYADEGFQRTIIKLLEQSA